MARLILASIATTLSAPALAAVELPNALCGPPKEVISAIESRGYINEPAFNTILPSEVNGRRDIALLAYMLNPQKAREEHDKTSGIFGQSVAWIIRTDAEAGKPLGWACLYQEVPLTEKVRREMLERANQVNSTIE